MRGLFPIFKNLLTVSILLFSCFADAQDKPLTSVSGKVYDSANKSPLLSATVEIYKTVDSSLITRTITDEKGTWMIEELPFGQYYAIVSYLSYNASKSDGFDLDQLHPAVKLGVLYLSRSKEIDLKETVIIGKKALIELKSDKLIFNVDQSLSISGGDAVDALKKTPGVKVSESSVGLTGKNAVKVLVNNRVIQLSGTDLIAYLKTFSTDQLNRIEVISNPPSNFDAEGSSGIINIVTKKNKNIGLSGLISSGITKATYYSGNVGSDINYNTGKWNLHFGARTSKSKYSGLSNEKTFYPDQLWDNSISYPYGTKTLSLNGDLDYQLNKNNLLGFSFNNSISSAYQNPNSSTSIFSNTSQLDSLINTRDSRRSKPHNNALNVHFESKLDTIGKKLNIDADFFGYDNNQAQQYFSDSYSPDYILLQNSSLKSISPRNIKIYTAKAEFVLPGKVVNLTMGTKVSFIKNLSSASYYNVISGQDIFDPDKSNAFDYNENTQAVYITAGKEVKKWSFQLGVRAEATQTKGFSDTYNQTTLNRYLRLFPTAFISNKINENNSLVLSYTRRIDRPDYMRLNPFKSYSNPYSYAEGNPFLQPAYNDNFELSHQYKNWLISKFYLNIQHNGFDQIALPDEASKTTVIIQSNYLKNFNYGLNEAVTFNIFNWLETVNEADLYFKRTISSDPRTKRVADGLGAYLSTDNTATLNKSKTLFFGMSFWYQFPEVSNLVNFDSYYSLDISLRAKLYHNRISLNLVGQDVLKTMKQEYAFYTLGIRQNVSNYSDNRRARLSISYKFGGKTKAVIKSESNKEEKNRIK